MIPLKCPQGHEYEHTQKDIDDDNYACPECGWGHGKIIQETAPVSDMPPPPPVDTLDDEDDEEDEDDD